MPNDFIPPPNFGDMLYGDFHDYEDTTPEPEQPIEVADIPPEQPSVEAASIPDYISSDWVPTPESDIEWYKQKYAELMNYANSEEFTSILADKYKTIASQEDERLMKYKDVVNALEGGDTLPLKLYFPDKLQEMGISPVLSEQEVDGLIEETMKKEYGDDYQSVYNERDALRPSSVSAKMIARTMELQKQYSEENKQRQLAFETARQNIPVPQSTQELTPDQYYETIKDQISKEEYDALLPQIQESMNKWSLLDLKKIITYENDMKAAEERGKAEGRRLMLAEVKSAGAMLPMALDEPRKRQETPERRPGQSTGAWKDLLMGNFIGGTV